MYTAYLNIYTLRWNVGLKDRISVYVITHNPTLSSQFPRLRVETSTTHPHQTKPFEVQSKMATFNLPKK